MGFPMVQVVMIAARQVSKPVADAVIRYGKDHPTFRSKVLLPVGRSIVHLTTRLRMKRLGLGEVTSNVQVSESAALEQASDFVQQVVIFVYSVSVFAGYYFYSKWTTEETVKMDEYKKLLEEFGDLKKAVDENRRKLDELVTKTDSMSSKLHPILAEDKTTGGSSPPAQVKNRHLSGTAAFSPSASSYSMPIDDVMLTILTETN